MRRIRFCLSLTNGVLLTLMFAGSPSFAQTPAPSSAYDKASALIMAQNWDDAALAFDAITRAEPDNGLAWYRLGFALRQAGKYEPAIRAYQQAVKKTQGTLVASAMYELGASYARMNDKDEAFDWLTKALNAGVSRTSMLKTDPDLAHLREDKERFQSLLTLSERVSKPCLYRPENQQVGFLVGEWSAQNSQGQRIGTSSIKRDLDGCLLLASWTDIIGSVRQSITVYDVAIGKWRQTLADSTGGVSEFNGEYMDGAVRFVGEFHGQSGAKTQRRLTLFNLGGDRFRYLSETSTDGKTWAVDRDLTYVRKEAVKDASKETPGEARKTLATFDVLAVPDKLRDYNWTKLMEDGQGDGRLTQSADGKALYYFYDPASDTLWFKLELYSKVNWDTPAVSISIDIDADQITGIPWYGANKKFTFEKMLSVGPTGKQEGKYLGYNGITNIEGVKARDWINEKSGVITFYVDAATNSYILGVQRKDIAPELRKFNVIGSVGENALWNDDIGEQGFATIELKPER